MDRSKFIGGSDVAAIMGASPFKSAYRLWQEMTGRVEPQDISELFHVQRGVSNEPVALALIEDKLGRRFEANKRFTDGYKSGEVDGIDEQGIVEIKCMGKDNHEAAARGELPEHYNLQMQYYMVLADRPECEFVSYRPEDQTLHSFTVKADAKLQKKILKAVDKFWVENILIGTEPELSDMDYSDMEADQSLRELAQSYKEYQSQKEAAEAALSGIKAELDKLMAANNTTKARGCGLVMNKHSRKGNVNYKKIPELEGVDLEQYRGKPISVFTVRISK